MKILFSEYPAEYSKYYFPYHVWAVEESIADRNQLLNQGFLPTRFKIGLWYLARSCRIELSQFEPSSENRRILKQTDNIETQFKSSNTFNLTSDHLSLIREYIDSSIPASFSDSAIKRIFSSHLTQTVETYTQNSDFLGLSPIMVSEEAAFYWYGFYNPEYQKSGLGMRAMIDAVIWAQSQDLSYIYLGTCYTKGALYKTNIAGFEFFDGFSWNNDIDQLKYLIEKDNSKSSDDLLLDAEYQNRFYNSPNLTKFLKSHA